MLQSKLNAPDFADLVDSLTTTPDRQRRAEPRGGKASPVQIGLPIDHDDDGSITPVVTSLPAGDGVALSHKSSNSALSLREWVLRAIGTEARGVLCAWPAAPGLKSLPNDRIMALDAHSNLGKSSWWMKQLRATKFSNLDSHVLIGTQASTTVYRVGGEPLLSWNFFPSGRNYGMDSGEIDAFLHFGLAVTVQRAAAEHATKSMEAQLAAIAIPTYLELEAASVGLAPPVFATFPIFNDATNSVTGSLIASQLHTFTLADMLEAHASLRPEDNAKLVLQQLRDASVEIASKLRRLAQGSILKLNMTPHTIAFCPKLSIEEGGDGESWSLSGFGFKVGDKKELIAGKPHFTNFHSPVCKRLSMVPDVDSAFVLMTAVLLESVQAEFGGVAARIMRDAMLEDGGRDAAVVSKAVESAQASSCAGLGGGGGFLESAQRLFGSPVVNQAMAEFAQSLGNSASPLQALLPNDVATHAQPRFQSLLKSTLGTRTYDPPELVPHAQIAADHADDRRVRAAIGKILADRHACVPRARFRKEQVCK